MDIEIEMKVGLAPASFAGETESEDQLVASVGVPLIVHDGDNVRPAGREPDTNGQKVTAVPPRQVSTMG